MTIRENSVEIMAVSDACTNSPIDFQISEPEQLIYQVLKARWSD